MLNLFKSKEKTPYFIARPKKAVEQYNKVKENFTELLPEISYFVNANSESWMLNELKKEELTFTATSYEQAIILIQQQITPDKISILSPTINKEEVEKCQNIGVTKFCVYSKEQLKQLRNSKGVKRIVLKVKTKDEDIGLTLRETNTIMGESSELDDISGFHYAFGTQNMHSKKEYSLFSKFILFSVGIKKAGYKLEEIELSCGFPIQYTTPVPTLQQICNELKRAISPLIQNDLNIKLVIGRFIAAPTVELVTTVKLVDNTDVYVDASSYNAYIDCILLKQQLELSDERQGNKLTYTIRGNSLDYTDIISEVEIPQLNQGEELIFVNLGAYKITTRFGDMKELKTVIK